MKKTFHDLCNEIRENVKECSVSDVMKWKDEDNDLLLVDIREDNEFNAGRIKGAIHVGKGIIERDMHLYAESHDKKIVLYCGGGFRSVLAADSLQRMGYNNVISMRGGWKAWNTGAGEIEK